MLTKLRKYFAPIWVIIILCLMMSYYLINIQLPPADAVELVQNYRHKVILIPLDTRPPCQKMVIDSGKMAGIEVITPPSEIMDYYTLAGDTKELRKWLLENVNQADGVIVSVDQLLHGGLLASREASSKDDDSATLLQFLRQLKQLAPDKEIYAFNILPRITPPPTINSSSKKIIKISRLIDEINTFGNKDDIKLLEDLKQDIDKEDLNVYLDLFKRNTKLNKELINLANEGVITKLIIGQDDGEDFGVPNMEKKALVNYLHSNNINSDKVLITRGADEVALSLLASFVQKQTHYKPKVFIEYNDDKAPNTIMPFMAGSVGSTVEEKLIMANSTKVDSPSKAGIILYIYIGTDTNGKNRQESARKIKKYLQEGKKVALVDLSKHFSAQESLFPILLKEEVPINQLISYAGWNTASNSIGTAFANAIIYKAMRPEFNNTNDILCLEFNRLTLLYNRILEDYYYLKDIIDVVNTTLVNNGYKNVNDLDIEHNYKWAKYILQTSMDKKADSLWQTKSAQMPITVQTPEGNYKLTLRYLKADAYFPWPRTFEIYLDSKLNLYKY